MLTLLTLLTRHVLELTRSLLLTPSARCSLHGLLLRGPLRSGSRLPRTGYIYQFGPAFQSADGRTSEKSAGQLSVSAFLPCGVIGDSSCSCNGFCYALLLTFQDRNITLKLRGRRQSLVLCVCVCVCVCVCACVYVKSLLPQRSSLFLAKTALCYCRPPGRLLDELARRAPHASSVSSAATSDAAVHFFVEAMPKSSGPCWLHALASTAV